MSCSKCGCSPCKCQTCDPAVLNQPRIFNPQVSGGFFQNGTYQSPMIEGGTSNGQSIVGATIDCTTIACQQPTGTCNSTLATTAFVCVAIQEAISGLNPTFCTAVDQCISAVPASFCAAVQSCINTVPSIIDTTQAFGTQSRATANAYGVVRYATQAQIENALCTLAIDPCTLAAVFSALPNGSPFSNAFEMSVNNIVTAQLAATLCADVAACGFQTTASLCADVAACGFAPLASPAFTGTPTAPTPAPTDNSTLIATTAFVQGEITSALATAIDSGNAAFCAAVNGCIVAGPATLIRVSARFGGLIQRAGVPAQPTSYTTLLAQNCSTAYALQFLSVAPEYATDVTISNFTLADSNYQVAVSMVNDGAGGIQQRNPYAESAPGYPFFDIISRSTTSCVIRIWTPLGTGTFADMAIALLG